jgi:hypothetical protein
MDKEKTSQISFWPYWGTIWKNALRRAWDKVGAWGTVAGIVTSIIVSILAKYPKSWGDFWHKDAITAMVIFLAIFAIVFLLFICKEPVTIFNKQQNIIEELKPRNINVDVFESSRENPNQAYGEGRIRFKVINHDPADLIECYAKLEFVYPVINGVLSKLIPSEWHSKKLFWSSQITRNGNITITGNSGSELLEIIDIGNKGLNFLFQNDGLQTGFDSQERELVDGTYLFGIRLDGKVNGKSISPIRKSYMIHFEQVYNVENFTNPNVPQSIPIAQIKEMPLQLKEINKQDNVSEGSM